MGGYHLQILHDNFELNNISLEAFSSMVALLSAALLFAYCRYVITSFSFKKVVIFLGLLGYYAVLSLGLIGEMWMFI
jgi:hypothetical protein